MSDAITCSKPECECCAYRYPDCECDPQCDTAADCYCEPVAQCDTRHLSVRDGIAHAFSHVYAELDPEPYTIPFPDGYPNSSPD